MKIMFILVQIFLSTHTIIKINLKNNEGELKLDDEYDAYESGVHKNGEIIKISRFVLIVHILTGDSLTIECDFILS